MKPEREKVKEMAVEYQHGIGASPGTVRATSPKDQPSGSGRMGDHDKEGWTTLHCPRCRKSSNVRIGSGSVDVWCRHCRKAFVAKIRPKREKREMKKGKEVEPRKDDGKARGV